MNTLFVKLLLAFIILFPSVCLSQVDSSYVASYDRKLSVRTYFSKTFVNLSQEKGSEDTKTYLPNTPVNIGLGFSIRNTVINFSYGYGFAFMKDKEKGKTKTTLDFQLHNYSRKFVFDIFAQQYKGFYEDNDADKNYVLCPDLKIHTYGVFGQYVFNNKRFSYKAAFNQNEIQRKSAGSFLAGVGAYYTEIKSDSSFFYNGKNSFSSFQFGINGGYAYTWVIDRHWFISGSVSVGINLGSEKINSFGKRKIEVFPTTLPRVSGGYNHKSWSLGVSAVTNVLFHSISSNKNITVNPGSLEFKFIKRFRSIPLLYKDKKRHP